jgi:hypothetical protein
LVWLGGAAPVGFLAGAAIGLGGGGGGESKGGWRDRREDERSIIRPFFCGAGMSEIAPWMAEQRPSAEAVVLRRRNTLNLSGLRYGGQWLGAMITQPLLNLEF